MIKELKTYSTKLTRALANEWAEMARWDGERPLSPRHVQFLRNAFDEGRFTTPRWGSALLNGKRYRVNGQHSATMLKDLNGTFPNSMTVLITEHECDTYEDLVNLFQAFDSPVEGRGFADYVRVYMATRPDLVAAGVTVRDGTRAASAMSFHTLSGGRSSPRDRARCLALDHAFVITLADFPRTRLISVPVGGAMYGSWCAARDSRRVSISDWRKFWGDVFGEADPSPKAPSRVLARYLRAEAMEKSSTPRAIYIRCIHAWNAWRSGSSTKLRYAKDAPIPEIR